LSEEYRYRRDHGEEEAPGPEEGCEEGDEREYQRAEYQAPE